MKITDHVHSIGTDSTVNAYLLEEGGEVTIIDAAMPGYRDDIPRALAALVLDAHPPALDLCEN